MDESTYFSNFRTGREIAGFVDTLKNQREGEDSSISDNITTSMDLRGECYKNASTVGCNPCIAEEGALQSEIFVFKIPYENH